jgi:cytochrome P450 family 142 subfamily A polypeptide 1
VNVDRLEIDGLDVDLLDGDFYAGDPFPTYARLRADAPAYWDAGNQLWGVSRYADVVAIEKDPQRFCSAEGSRPGMSREMTTTSMIDRDDPRHNVQRRLVYKGFTPKRVGQHELHVRELVTHLIDKVAPRGECDFVHDLAAPLPMIVIAEMLGARPEDWHLLQEWSDKLVQLGGGPRYMNDERMAAVFAFYDYTTPILAARKGRPTDDLISILAHAEIDGSGLSDEELLSESLLLLIGGNETSRNAMTGAMDLVSRHPDQWRLLRDEPSRLPVAVEEFLRYVTPILNMARTATVDVELHGRTIRAGDKLLLMYSSANRDEGVFDAPETFDITRDPNPHVAFGFGTHFCLGASLARMEIRVMYEELLRRLPDIHVVPGHDVRWTPGAFVRGIDRLPVEFTKA